MLLKHLDMLRKIKDDLMCERERLDIELAKLDELIASNESPSISIKTPIVRPSIVFDKEIKTPPHSLSSPGIMHKAIALAVEMYDKRPGFITTGEVLTGLEKQGLMVGGKSPSGNVSSYLKHTDDLANFRGYGWVRSRDKERWEQYIKLQDQAA